MVTSAVVLEPEYRQSCASLNSMCQHALGDSLSLQEKMRDRNDGTARAREDQEARAFSLFVRLVSVFVCAKQTLHECDHIRHSFLFGSTDPLTSIYKAKSRCCPSGPNFFYFTPFRLSLHHQRLKALKITLSPTNQNTL